MKNEILVGLISLSLTAIYSCSDLHTGNYGYLYTSVLFSQKAFVVKEIPLNTFSIAVEVTGDGLVQPLSFNLTRENPKKLLNNVPTGIKLVKATARDNKGLTLATGENSVSVKANITNTVEVTLTEIAVSAPIPTQSPVNTVQPVSSTPTAVPVDNPVNSPGVVVTVKPPEVIASPTLTPTPMPTPTPTNSSSISGGGSSSFTGGDNSDVGPNAVVNVTTLDGSPQPSGIVVQIVSPSPSGF